MNTVFATITLAFNLHSSLVNFGSITTVAWLGSALLRLSSVYHDRCDS